MGDELILVVDDSQEVCSEVCRVLEDEHYRTMMAHSGKDGIRTAVERNPDLILLDYQLGDMQAPDVIKALKRRQFDIPVVLITGEGSEQIAVNLFRLGIKDYLIKPVDGDDLLEVVDRSLKETRLQRQNELLTAQLTATMAKVSQRNEILKQRSQELNVLFNVTRSFTSTATSDGLLQLVMGAAITLTACSEGGLFLLENGTLLCRAVKAPHEPHPRTLNEAASDPLVRQAFETRRLVIADGGMAAPIVMANRPIGALVVRGRDDSAKPFASADRNLLTMLANIAAMMFDGAHPAAAAAAGGGGGSSSLAAPRSGGVSSPPQPHSDMIFISHSSHDWHAYVAPLVGHLQEAGFKTWVYRHDRSAGRDFMDTINRMLTRASCLVLCVTPHAMESRFVRVEYRYFFYQEKPIVPIIFEPVELLPAELMSLDNVPGDNLPLLVHLLHNHMAGL